MQDILSEIKSSVHSAGHSYKCTLNRLRRHGRRDVHGRHDGGLSQVCSQQFIGKKRFFSMSASGQFTWFDCK